MRRIVCAAIRAEDGQTLLGIRHYSGDMYTQIYARNDGEKFCHRSGDDQGFVDQHGVYLTREEAYIVAKEANQITDEGACRNIHGTWRLFSEGLY